MKTNDYLILAAAAAGAYVLYKSFYGGTSRQEATRSFLSSGAKVQNSTYSPGSINVTYEGTNWGSTNTTYKFSPEEFSRYNWAQQILNEIGFIPKSWIFGG